MRILLIGPADARARLRHALAGGPLVVAAEAENDCRRPRDGS
jgi:hypothetical protein